MKIFLRISLTIVAIALLIFVGVTVSFNRAQPSSVEINEAIIINHSLQKYLSSKKESILWSASRNNIEIEVSGIVNIEKQKEIIDETKKILIKYPFSGKVFIKFYPERKFIENRINGRIISQLVEQKLLVEIEINNSKEEPDVRF